MINEAYNTITKKWSKVAACPVYAHHYSGGVVFNNICITNYIQCNAHIYDTKTNTYAIQMALPANHWKPAGHGYILTNQCMYQAEGNDTNKWKTIQYQGSVPAFNSYHGISYLFKRGKYLYAIDNGYVIWQVDTELFQVKRLVTT